MKGTYLVAILVVILGIVLNGSLADIPIQCPETNPRNETVFIPHESDCTKFYSCHMGVKGKPIDCPPMDKNGNKLHFNPELQVCDWPWSARCQTSSSTSTTSSSIPTSIITPNTTISLTPTTPIPSSPITPTSNYSSTSPTTPTSNYSSTTTIPTSTTPTSTTPTPSSSTPTTLTPSSPTSTTSTSSSPTPTTPTTPTPSSSTTTTLTPSSPTSTTSTSSSPTPTTPTTPTPSSSIPTTPTTSTPSFPTSTTPTLSSSTSTTPTPSSPMPTTPTTPTPNSPTPTTPTTSTPSSSIPTTPTTSTPSSPTSTTPTLNSSTSTTPIPSSPMPTTPTTPTPSSPMPTTSTSSSPTTSSDSCISDDREHMLPHKIMCDHYYSCFNGRISTTPQKCDRNLLFNSLLRVCDYPENVNCKNSLPNMDKSNPSSISPPFNSSNLPTNSDPVTWVCEPNGKYYKIPHEIKCDYYYWCVNGTKGTDAVRCESNLLFNPVIGECDYWENVDCEKRITSSPDTTVPCPTSTPTTPTTTTPTTTSSTTTTPTTPTTTIPTTSTTPTTTTPTTPTTTTPTTKTPITPTTPTPTTTTITPITTTPTISTETTTKEITMTTPTETTTTKNSNEPRNQCPPKGSTEKARIAHPCLCNRYYDCIDGEKILQTCPIGKHFDYVREICDWVSVVKCIRPIPTFNILISDIIIDDYNTTCAPEGREFQHATDCSAYYSCSNGEKILRRCMEGLQFNMTIQTCDYPQKSCDLNKSSPRTNLDICPPPDSIQKVFLPHECECTQYYECTDGKKFLRFCPNRLHFDPVWQICNDPIEVKCVADTISTTSTSIFTTSSTTKAIDEPRTTCLPKGSTEKLRLPHPCLCNQYYECVEGDKILRTCPIDMYFDDVTEICDWSTKVNCISQFPSHDIQINDYDINNKCSPNGRAFNHEDSCTEYYLCSKGEKVLQHCLEGLHFNVSIQMCDYPQKKCDLNTSRPQPIPTVTLEICPPTGSVQQVLLPHECDCTKYYECIDGKQILRGCSDGLYYDYVRQICNVPIEVKCNVFTTTIPESSFPTIPDSSKCYDENNEIPHENDCRFYYKCNNGEKILKTCPRNLYFNPKLRVCDYPENVACNVERNIPSTSTPIKCEIITETTSIPHENECNLYYVCKNGVSILKKCPPNLVFNPILKVCDFPENYVCNVTRDKNNIKKIDEIVQNLDPSTCIGICPEEDPDYAVLLPNDDCKKFCMCSGGVAWVQLCPEPLYFDSVEKICKKKKDAVCGVRSYNQDSVFTIDKTVDNDNSMKILTAENNERATYDNLDPSTCIGTCPEEDPEYAVLLPNDDCKKFCLCSGGVAWVQPCPDPLYFDSVKKICKRKKDAVCGVRLYNQDSVFMIDKTVDNDNSMKILTAENNERATYDNLDPSTCIGTCPEEDPEYAVLLPNDDCKKFCLCSGGVAWVQPCPDPLYFDSVKKICKRKKDAVCGVRLYNQDSVFMIDKTVDNDNSMKILTAENNERATYDNLDPSTCIGTCPEEDPEYAVLLPNDDCKKFCLCSGGVAWVQPCPEPLYFDSVEKICKKKKDAVCGVRSYNQDSVFTIDKTVDNDNSMKILTTENNERATYDNLDPSTCIGTCPEEDPEYAVLLPNDDCKKFCLCSGGVAWVQPCPEPLYFDSVQKICKRKKDAVCGVRLFNEDRVFMLMRKGNKK